jgi:hypothetical protein
LVEWGYLYIFVAMELPKELTDRLYQARLNAGQFVAERTDKKQVVLHHSAGPALSSGGGKRLAWNWNNDQQGAVATAFTFDRDGKIAQHFSSMHWAWGLGIGVSTNRIPTELLRYRKVREQGAIQIEFDSWGGLRERGSDYVSWTGKVIPKEELCILDKPHRGMKVFHKVTDEQIKACEIMLKYCHDRYGIPLDYNEDMWDISERALRGAPGVWTHNSFVSANLRNDIFPQPELIQMLKSLA